MSRAVAACAIIYINCFINRRTRCQIASQFEGVFIIVSFSIKTRGTLCLLFLLTEGVG